MLGLYAGLRAFENDPKISLETIRNDRMKINRNPTKATGPITGYFNGIKGQEMLDERSARFHLFIEPYRVMLEGPEERAQLKSLKAKLKKDPSLRLVLVDTHSPGSDWEDLDQDISHCALLRDYLNGTWPQWTEEEEEEEDDEEEEDEAEQSSEDE